MSDALIGTIITGIITIFSVFISSKNVRDKVTNEMQTQNALQSQEIQYMKEDIKEMKADIKEHNHYAKLYNENVPVLQEQIKVANHRIEKLERGSK